MRMLLVSLPVIVGMTMLVAFLALPPAKDLGHDLKSISERCAEQARLCGSGFLLAWQECIDKRIAEIARSR